MDPIEYYEGLVNRENFRIAPFQIFLDALLEKEDFDGCIRLADYGLSKNPKCKHSLLYKIRALTEQMKYEDLDVRDEVFVEEVARPLSFRPGTSFKKRTQTRRDHIPLETSGRPRTGVCRPETAKIPEKNKKIDIHKWDLRKFALEEPRDLSRALVDYLLFVEKNPRLVHDFCRYCLLQLECDFWFFQHRLARACSQLSMFREAEQALLLGLDFQPESRLYLELVKLYCRMDQPTRSLQILDEADRVRPSSKMKLARQRILEELDEEPETQRRLLEEILDDNMGNLEAAGKLSTLLFYNDEPELSLKVLKNLFDSKCEQTSLFNNLALASLYSHQLDLVCTSFLRALQTENRKERSEIFHNLGILQLQQGCQDSARLCFSHAKYLDYTNLDSATNYAVLEYSRNRNSGIQYMEEVAKESQHLHQPQYNLALVAFREGRLRAAAELLYRALEISPTHSSSLSLLEEIREIEIC